jgi:hypothetical protein
MGVSVPCGLVDGLPVGFQIIGRHGDEATVLRVARALEGALTPLPRQKAGQICNGARRERPVSRAAAFHLLGIVRNCGMNGSSATLS